MIYKQDEIQSDRFIFLHKGDKEIKLEKDSFIVYVTWNSNLAWTLQYILTSLINMGDGINEEGGQIFIIT